MDFDSRWLGSFVAVFSAIAGSHSAVAQIVVLDAFDQPAGGQSLTAVAAPGSSGGFNSSREAIAGVPGGVRDLFVVTDAPPPISSGTILVNNGAPGLTLGITPGRSGWCGISYGFTGDFILDLGHASAFRLENVTSDNRIFVYLGIIDQSGYRADLSFNISQPVAHSPVDFPIAWLVPQQVAHPVDLTRISHLSFGIVEDVGGQTHVGSFELLPVPTAVPEPTTATGWLALILGIWAVHRIVAKAKDSSRQ